MGKLIGASSMLVGIFVLALPISVISTTFGEVWHEWKEELRLEAQSREEDLRSVELALQIIENRTHLTIEIYDHSDRYPPELLGHVQWRTLPLDSQETVECRDDSFPIKSLGLRRSTKRLTPLVGFASDFASCRLGRPCRFLSLHQTKQSSHPRACWLFVGVCYVC